MSFNRRRRGFALLLVIVVTVALIAIAIPFAISMRHQERGAQGSADRAHARYQALAGRNHALASVIRGHETIEESKGAKAPFNTPFSDTLAEFAVGWNTAVPTHERPPDAGAKVRGAALQDEQGKINVRTAPQIVVDHLNERLDPRTHDLRDFLTRSSQRFASWVAPQSVRGIVPATAPDGSPALTLFIDDNVSYSENSVVRVQSPTGAAAASIVVGVDPNGGSITIKIIPDTVSQVGALVEVECRHPVNINTAPKAVIAACLEGLGRRGKLTEDRVTKDEANNLAERMVKQTFPTYDEFATWLSEQRGLSVISNVDESAITINFTNPNARDLEGTGTLPFVLQSGDYVTVVSQGLQDLPSGVSSAASEIRDIVELAPAGTLRWRVRSQYDMERQLKLPLGRGVVTWPACTGAREIPSQDRSTDAWVTVVTGKDTRANWKIQNHFDPWQQGFSMKAPPLVQRAGQILKIEAGNVDIEAGAAEFWFKTPATTFTAFDAGSEIWSNRLWLFYGYDQIQNATVLRFVAKDSTLDHTYAEVVYRPPSALTPDTWYHVGAFWKGTKFGHLMITLDGLPVGQYGVWTEQGQSRHATLSGQIVATDTTITAASSVAGFPAPGVIEIGNEVIEYAAVSGNSFTGCIRGARNQAGAAGGAQVHQAGVGITEFGYVNRLIRGTATVNAGGTPFLSMVWDRLTVGGGTLASNMGVDTLITFNLPSPMPNPPPNVLIQGATTFNCPAAIRASGNPLDFPVPGWIAIGGGRSGMFVGGPTLEIIAYTGVTADSFTGLQRGLYGTSDKNHPVTDSVIVFGFHASDNTNYLSPTVLAVGDEWFGPLHKESTTGWRGHLGTLSGVEVAIGIRAAPGQMGFWQTPAIAHTAGEDILPTFSLATDLTGPDDIVTFVEQDPATREQHTVQHVRWMPALVNVTTSPNFLLASLDDNVAKEWVPDNLWVRILKFPSGELPGINIQQITFGSSALAGAQVPMTGFIDELRMTNGPKFAGFTISIAVDASLTTIPILDVSGMDPEGGAILCGNELIGYAGVDATSNELINCTRGYLGSVAAPHEAGDKVFNMAFLAIASLTGGIGPDDKIIPCAPNNFPQDGYVMIGGQTPATSEIVGYTGLGNGGLYMTAGVDFRGAYGTTKTAHVTNDLVYCMPFRAYDRFSANTDDAQEYWYGASFRATAAEWRRITWEERLPNDDVDLRVSVRFGGVPRWTQSPNNKPYVMGKGGIWVFDRPGNNPLTDSKGDQVEVKVEFIFKDGAYANGRWKESPEFRGLTVEYEQEPVVHYHEER